MTVGKVTDLLKPETYLSDKGLLLRMDQRGFYIMSTECTYDLTSLQIKDSGGSRVLLSSETDSKYDLSGKVLSGPAKFNLPYYKLKYGQGKYGGKVDHLFVYIGKEESPDWRLPVPEKLLQAVEITEGQGKLQGKAQ